MTGIVTFINLTSHPSNNGVLVVIYWAAAHWSPETDFLYRPVVFRLPCG